MFDNTTYNFRWSTQHKKPHTFYWQENEWTEYYMNLLYCRSSGMPGGTSWKPCTTAWQTGRFNHSKLYFCLHNGHGHGTPAPAAPAVPARHYTPAPGTVPSGARTPTCYRDLYEGTEPVFLLVTTLKNLEINTLLMMFKILYLLSCS